MTLPIHLDLLLLSSLKKKVEKMNQWTECNIQGFIPGPTETEEKFLERVSFCKNLEQHLSASKSGFPFQANDPQSKEIVSEAFDLTEKLYGIRPNWVPAFFSNYQMSPWHGGCAWIFQLDAHSPVSAFLQLRAKFLNDSTFLKIYKRKELLAHELAHVGRMNYQEPQFEEMFAYQSSSAKWRRFFGPIVQSSKESLYFILLLGLAVIADAALITFPNQINSISILIKLIPILVLLLALGRLYLRHRIFEKCKTKLASLFGATKGQHLLYRLTDKEIKHFSKSSLSSIQTFIEGSSKSSFRWKFLKTLYSEE